LQSLLRRAVLPLVSNFQCSDEIPTVTLAPATPARGIHGRLDHAAIRQLDGGGLIRSRYQLPSMKFIFGEPMNRPQTGCAGGDTGQVESRPVRHSKKIRRRSGGQSHASDLVVASHRSWWYSDHDAACNSMRICPVAQHPDSTAASSNRNTRACGLWRDRWRHAGVAADNFLGCVSSSGSIWRICAARSTASFI